MCKYLSSLVKRKSFYRKSKLQMFLLISGGQTVNQYGVSLPPSSRAPRVSLAPKTPFPFPFKRLPRRLGAN